MIAHAKSVSHGINLLNYISCETANKKNPEKIFHVENRFLPDELDSLGIWDIMKSHCKLKNNLIRIEISPSREYTKNFTMDDWRDLWHDFMEEYDKIELKSQKAGEIYSHKTNLAGSKSTCWLHMESHSGIPHLHAAVCRYDEQRNLNNDHDIHIRAQRAAEAVALKRGWKTAMQKHDALFSKVNADVIAVLKAMPKWDWEDYVVRLSLKGYDVNINKDKQGVVHGYSIATGNTRYKASQIGKGRNLLLSKIENTWQKLHQQPIERVSNAKEHQFTPDYERMRKYYQPHPGYRSYDFDFGNDHSYSFHLPPDIADVLDNEIDPREAANCDMLQKFAVALFLGAISAKDVPSSGGGGGGNNEGWRDKKDEDELERIRRCANFVKSKIGVSRRSGRRR